MNRAAVVQQPNSNLFVSVPESLRYSLYKKVLYKFLNIFCFYDFNKNVFKHFKRFLANTTLMILQRELLDQYLR